MHSVPRLRPELLNCLIASSPPKVNQPSPDPLEFLKSLWGPMGLPGAGFTMPTLDAGEIEKRIADLRAVETWLDMNLSMLRMAIQGMEMQKATLAAMKAPEGAGGAQPPHPAVQAWLNALQGKGGGGPPEKDR